MANIRDVVLILVLFSLLILLAQTILPSCTTLMVVQKAPTNDHPATNLETRLEKLESENVELEKRVDEDYPSLLQRNASDLATLGTLATIILGVLGTAAALSLFQKYRQDLLTESLNNAMARVDDLHEFIKARILFAMGSLAGRTAWDRSNDWKPTGLNHLSLDAFNFSERSLHLFQGLNQDKLSKAYVKEIDELIVKSLNNTVFYACHLKLFSRAQEIQSYAEELKNKIDFKRAHYHANTYILARVIFRAAFAKTSKTDGLGVDDETIKFAQMLADIPELPSDASKELEKIIERLNEIRQQEGHGPVKLDHRHRV